ncbi:MAG: SLC13 family permease [Armatimonadota bacterium]
MPWEAWFTLAVVVLVFIGMVKEWGTPDVLLLAGTIACALVGIISTDEALRGFSNEGMLTVAALFIVAAAMRETGALDVVGKRMLGKATTADSVLRRMFLWVSTLSAFLNNTPIVAMLLPILNDWCRKNRVSPSKVLIPLSFFTILGGMCTLIGTSTNLVVRGLMEEAFDRAQDPLVKAALTPPGVFEISPLGIPVAIIGGLFIFFVGRRLLPDRKDLLEQLGESSREYLVDMEILPGCRLAGQTVEEAGLRHLPGLYLIEIVRGDRVITPVGPDQNLRAGDRLTFTGVVTSIVDLERIPGFVPAADEGYESRADQRRKRRLSEAVISPSSPLIGKTIRDSDFRAMYNAAVVAVHRGGTRLTGRVGDIELRAGDTLLLQTGPNFARAHRNNADFVLVSHLEGVRPVRHHRATVALILLGFLILLMVTEVVSVVMASFLIAALMIATRCISTADAHESVDWQTLISIAAAFGLGKALENSGAAEMIGAAVVKLTSGFGPVAVLAAIYLVTVIMTELISNNAAAALMFPLAVAVAGQLGVSPRPFAFAIMFGATLAFATPIGYQTNMMVYGPGGYRFTDFTRIGVPLNILLWIVACLLIPVFWPFSLR